MQLPSFELLAKNYDTDSNVTSVKKRIGGEVTQSWLGNNTCVIRVSKALNYAGEAFRVKRGHGMEVVKGADGFWYGFRVSEFKNYLHRTFGEAKVVKEKGKKINVNDFHNKRGIIGFDVENWTDATGHFSLWDGSKILYDGGHEYFSFPHIKVDKTTPTLMQVELWECK